MDTLESSKNIEDSLKPSTSFKEEERPTSPTLEAKASDKAGGFHPTGSTGSNVVNDKVCFFFSDLTASLQSF